MADSTREASGKTLAAMGRREQDSRDPDQYKEELRLETERWLRREPGRLPWTHVRMGIGARPGPLQDRDRPELSTDKQPSP